MTPAMLPAATEEESVVPVMAPLMSLPQPSVLHRYSALNLAPSLSKERRVPRREQRPVRGLRRRPATIRCCATLPPASARACRGRSHGAARAVLSRQTRPSRRHPPWPAGRPSAPRASGPSRAPPRARVARCGQGRSPRASSRGSFAVVWPEHQATSTARLSRGCGPWPPAPATRPPVRPALMPRATCSMRCSPRVCSFARSPALEA